MKRILVFVCMVLFLGAFVSAEYAAADRFVNNGNGTVTDTQTGLMWADHDNGSDINWHNAKSYCEGYSGGGKSGWRMPTMNELKWLHNSGAYGSVINITGSFVWSSETRGSVADVFYYFSAGGVPLFNNPLSLDYDRRALPVRSGQ